MQTFHEAGTDFEELSRLSKELLSRILPSVQPLRKELKIPGNQNLYGPHEGPARLYVIRSGNLRYERAERLLLMYEEGDLVGAERLFFPSEARVCSEYVTLVDEYEGPAFLAQVAKDPLLLAAWHKFLAAQTGILISILSCALQKETKAQPQTKIYHKGETILEEGVAGQEVYLLLDGKAEVWLQDRRIGEILRDEIFGALAVLTGRPRTATVKAAKECTVLILPAEQFQVLIQTRPQAVWQLLQSMARIIADLDKQVVALTPPK